MAGSTLWSLSLELHAVGREGAMTTIVPGKVTAGGNRVENRRESFGLSEWYVNMRSGIEQGFTIDRRPVAGGNDSPLILDVAFEGGLEARLDETDGAVLFSDDPSGTVLRYENLAVADADGNPVVAEMALLPGILRIAVRDEGHPYPLVIDPTIVVPGWTGLGDQFEEFFGASVAGTGDVNGDGFDDVIVGAYRFDGGFFDEGRVFVFTGSPTGPSPIPAWTAEGRQTGAWFGYSVASAGDVNGDGYADVIIRARKNLAEFGASVAGVGDVNGDGIGDVAIGGPRVGDQDTTAAGLVRVYYGNRTGLGNPPAFGVTETQPNALLGGSVAGAGDVNGDGLADIIAGAIGLDNVPLQAANSGGAHVYMGFRTRQMALPNGALHGIRFTD